MLIQTAQAATQFKQDQLGFQVGMAVAKKGLDAQKAQGEAAVQLLEAAAQISQSAGQGHTFDAIA